MKQIFKRINIYLDEDHQKQEESIEALELE